MRMRATYQRPHGIEHFLACYDVHGDYLNRIFRSRRGVAEVSEAFRQSRKCYPRKSLYEVLDNLHNVYDPPQFLALLKKLHIHPAGTPTEASWLNLIEAQFGVLQKFTLANTDDPDQECRPNRVYAYLRYRHHRLGNSNHPLKRLSPSRRVKLERH